jgi:hypothetical protein
MEKCDKKKIHISTDIFFSNASVPNCRTTVTPLSLEQTFSWEEIVSRFQFVSSRATKHNLIAIQIFACITYFVNKLKQMNRGTSSDSLSKLNLTLLIFVFAHDTGTC